MNNPLMYSDPSGEELVTLLSISMFAFWKAVIIGAAVGLASYSLSVAITGQKWTLLGAFKATFFGAVSGAVTFGIGDLFKIGSVVKAVGNAKFLVQGMAHGVAQGVLSVMQGGDFWSGAAAGFLGHLGAEAFGGVMKGVGLGKFAESTVGMVAFGALAGGVGSELSGGNFWQGALIGGVVAGLNSAMHKMGEPKPNGRGATYKIPRQPNGWDLNGDGKLQKNEADNWWLNGKGQTVNVDNSKIDWSGLEMPLNKPIGSNFSIETHTAFQNLPYETAATYGGTSFQRTGYREARVLDQKYHYDYRPNNSAKNVLRNFMNWAGKPSGQGLDYMIHYLNPTIKFK